MAGVRARVRGGRLPVGHHRHLSAPLGLQRRLEGRQRSQGKQSSTRE